MIDFTVVLKTFDGAPLTEIATGADGKPKSVEVTLGRMCCNALLGLIPGDPPPPGDEQLARYLLAMRIRDNGHADVGAEDVVLLKTRLAKMYPQAAHSGQAIMLLDPAAANVARAKAEENLPLRAGSKIAA